MRPILLPRSIDMEWDRVYQDLARNENLHAITQRDDEARTAAIINLALERIPFRPDDSVLDIGCGDGRFLRAFVGKAGRLVGTSLTEAEVLRLREAHKASGIDFIAGPLECLNLSGAFDHVTLISVLGHLGTRKAVRSALSVTADFCHPNGCLYVAGLAQIKIQPKRYGSTLRAVGFVRRTSGWKALCGFLVHLWKRRHRMGWYEAPRLPQYAERANEFIRLANECGFDLIQSWRCNDIPACKDHADRVDYLFKRQ